MWQTESYDTEQMPVCRQIEPGPPVGWTVMTNEHNRPLKCLRHASVKTMNRNAMWEKKLPVFTCMENQYDISTSKVYSWMQI